MTDYQCPDCGGGFPAADADDACPWCGETMNAGTDGPTTPQARRPVRPVRDIPDGDDDDGPPYTPDLEPLIGPHFQPITPHWDSGIRVDSSSNSALLDSQRDRRVAMSSTVPSDDRRSMTDDA